MSEKAHDVAQEDEREAEGVDEEDTSSQDNGRPFDPNKIRVTLWTPTLDLLLKRIEEGEIDLSPDFQRKAGIWKEKTQSQLIESLLIRLPLPAFYMDRIEGGGNKEDILAVIDGIQRLTALHRFVNLGSAERKDPEALVLTGLEFLKELEGKQFWQLPRPLQRRILETMVTVNVIEGGTPVEAKLNLFKRINTGGMTLTAQEIRHAINPGPVRDFLKDLAAGPEFRTATTDSMSDDRMDARECVLRFMAFLQTPPSAYPKEGNLDAFLNATMQAINKMNDAERNALAQRFCRAMARATSVLGRFAFRKLKKRGSSICRGRLNKALFEAWAVVLAGCTDAQIRRLERAKDGLVAALEDRMAKDRTFASSISQGTGDPPTVRYRFKVAEELVKEYTK